MTSQKQVAANRRNAKKSTGPRTKKGKKRVSRNGVTHGIHSSLTVLPEVENQCEWDRHLAQTRDDLRPNGYVGRALVDTIALDLWQLKRAARYQSELTSLAVWRAEADVEAEMTAKTPCPVVAEWEGQPYCESVEENLRDVRGLGTVISGLWDLPDEEVVRHGMLIIQMACRDAELDFNHLTDLPNVGMDPGQFPDADELADIPWTAALVRRAIGAVAESLNIESPLLILKLRTRIFKVASETYQRLIGFQIAVMETRWRRTLPEEHELEKICRYQVHIQRSISRRLEQLARLQKARGA